MTLATLEKISETYSSPPHIIGLWSCPNVPARTDSTALITFTLPAHNFFLEPYSPKVEKRLKQKAYAIDLRMISVSCLSDNYSIYILDKNDISLLQTVYEVACYCNINLSVSDTAEESFIIKNRDDILTNQIYFWIDNRIGTVDTGPISVELTYVVMQDRLDSQF
jgi:hypothetical protein